VLGFAKERRRTPSVVSGVASKIWRRAAWTHRSLGCMCWTEARRWAAACAVMPARRLGSNAARCTSGGT